MGILDFFKNESSQDSEKNSKTPWARKLRNYSDWEENKQLKVAKEL